MSGVYANPFGYVVRMQPMDEGFEGRAMLR